MQQIPNRQMLRREYLKRKRQALAKVAFGSTFGIVTGLAFIVSGFYLYCFLYLQWEWGGIPFKNPAAPPLWVYMTVSFLVNVACALLTWHSGKTIKYGITETKSLTYIPAVTLADTLPADEILVRGSEEPPIAQSEVLLRAAQKRQETPKEELLRVAKE